MSFDVHPGLSANSFSWVAPFNPLGLASLVEIPVASAGVATLKCFALRACLAGLLHAWSRSVREFT